MGKAKTQVLLILDDERSHFILGFGLEVSKSMEKAVELVRATVDTYGRPFLVKTDSPRSSARPSAWPWLL